MPKQRITDQSEIEGLLHEALVGHIAMCKDDEPYLVAVNFVYRDGNIYFHSSPRGQKIEFLEANPRVCFAVERVVRFARGPEACNFSTRYVSAMAHGTARFLDDTAEKKQALNWLVEKYAQGEPYAPVPDRRLHEVAVVEITVERLSGKRNVDREQLQQH